MFGCIAKEVRFEKKDVTVTGGGCRVANQHVCSADWRLKFIWILAISQVILKADSETSVDADFLNSFVNWWIFQ